MRLVDNGEADCALWIVATSTATPEWKQSVPTIALTCAPDRFRSPPDVAIAVGSPGVDHDAVEHLATAGTLTAVRARKRSNALSVADAIGKIAAALPAARPC